MVPARYEDSAGQRLTGRHRKSFRFIEGIEGIKVLDVGCSYGWFEKWALDNGCSQVIAIEPDAMTLREARAEAPGAAYLRASSLKLPLRSASVEKAVLWEVLEHLPKGSEIDALREINRVLKNGGCLYLSTPHKTFWACALDPAWWLVSHRHYSLGELKQYVRKAGFEVAGVDFGGGAWELFSMILLYVFKWCFRRDTPFKDFLESRRDREFASPGGWTNVFLKMRKIECAE